jgi:oxidoreductase
MAAAGETALLLGATGAVGKSLLGDLIKSSNYNKVHAFVRRPFKAESPYKDEDKLVEHVVDFDKLVDTGEGAQAFKDVKADTVYIALGTTRAQAGSAAQFERIDRQYVLNSAKAALLDNEEAQRIGQRVLYCSSLGATSSSPFLYPKSKGLTEEGLGEYYRCAAQRVASTDSCRSTASLGYPDCIIMRPSFLAGADRPQKRIVEQTFGVRMIRRCGDRVNLNTDTMFSCTVPYGKGCKPYQRQCRDSDSFVDQSYAVGWPTRELRTDHCRYWQSAFGQIQARTAYRTCSWYSDDRGQFTGQEIGKGVLIVVRM